jgi:hypothetical protein
MMDSSVTPKINAREFWRGHLDRNPSVLDPGTRIWEVVCGLIMVLTFTGTMSAAAAGRQEVGVILWAALGCNMAWGIVDALMFLMSVLLDRGHSLKALKAVRGPESKEAYVVMREYLPPVVAKVIQEKNLDEIRAALKSLPEPPARAYLNLHDIKNAVNIFLLVTLSTFPVAIPFFFDIDILLAMRISNGIVLLLLFMLGYFFAPQSGFSRILVGLLFASVGAVLVFITIALGG